MKFNELLENDTPPAEEIAEMIKKDCQPFLTKAKGVQMYRGTKQTTDDFFIGKGPTNRKPVDTDQELHEQINKIFVELGFKAHRGNSIFVSGSMTEASYFSSYHGPGSLRQIYTIFPIGDFYFTWSPHITDMYEEIDQENVPEDPDKLREFLEENYQHDNLAKAINTFNEIMISVDKYYAIDTTFYSAKVKKFIKQGK